MQTVFFNIDPNRKNYLICYIRPDGFAEIMFDAKTDDDLADAYLDLSDGFKIR